MAGEIATTGGIGSTLAGVANLAQLFLGTSQTQTDNRGATTTDSGSSTTTTNSGGTTTTTSSTSVAPGAVDALIKNILEGASGLAAVAGGQRTAGLYNSSTNQLLVSDLAARAAAEGAALNKTTTQTTTAPETTQTTTKAPSIQTTQNTGGTTTVKPAAINPLIPAGIIGALQLTPQSVKDTIKTSLGVGVKGVADSVATDTANPDIEAIYNDPSRALDVPQTAPTALDGLASTQNVSSFDTSSFTGTDVSSGAADTSQSFSAFNPVNDFSGGDEAGSAFDVFAGGDSTDFSDTVQGITDALGGFLSGLGSTAADTVVASADGVGSFLDDLDFTFADGGIVSKKAFEDKVKKHGNVRHMANGGVALSDLSGTNYITNTGLRTKAPALYSASSSGGNNQDIQKAIKESIQNIQSVVSAKPAGTMPANGSGYNSSAPISADTAGPDGAVADPDAAVSGIAGVLGANPSAVSAISSGISAGFGVPGGVLGLGNAANRDQAMQSAAITAVGIANPMLGLALSLGLKAIGAVNSGNDSGDSGPSRGPGGSSGEAGAAAGGATAAGPGGYGSAEADAAVSDAVNAGIAGLAEGVSNTDSSSSSSSSSNSASGGGAGSEGGVGGGTNGSGDAGTSADGTYASGGTVRGKGTGTSDSIPAMLSDGEYVISADVVKALGIPFFDEIQKRFHTRAAV